MSGLFFMKIKSFWQKIKGIIGLSFQLSKSEFILRNEGSYLGIFWYLLNPILMFGLLFLVFNDSLGSGIDSYVPYLFLGIVMFNFFQNATLESTKSIIQEHHTLIKSINFPRESLIVSITLKNLFSHLLEVLLFIIVLFFSKINIFAVIYYFPVAILFLLFVLGICLMLSSLTVYFLDLENIWNFAVRIIWLGTPIFYAIEGQTRLSYLNLLNPMYYFITIARDLIIYNKVPQGWFLLTATSISFFSLFIGLFVFYKLKARFAELI